MRLASLRRSFVTSLTSRRWAPYMASQEADVTQCGPFRRLAREALPYAPDMVVEKWRSTQSGLTVLWASFDSPLLNAYITLATEIFTDSGVPHTLEHLVFLGSQQYPYKGVLDSLANRAFAQGTNAWTANDHTAYTLTTAGADGFLRMLPVYCDHVFFPTLTNAGFTTEVYHVNGQGEDAGVVYSEMQGRENSSADLMELKTQRMLYPRSSAYRSETGGLMAALRVLTIDDIRAYHAQYYMPHNAALVLCGALDRAALFETLQQIDARFVEQQCALGEQGPPGWRRPFVETESAVAPVIDASRLEVPGVDDAAPPLQPLRRRAYIEFPEKDESVGEVQISWIGPHISDTLALQALDVLGTYLTDSPVSPVQKAFVERDDPLCTDVYFGNSERAGASVLGACFSSVPTAKLDDLDHSLHTLFETVARDGVDMTRMATVLRRERERLLSQLEMRPADCFSDVLIHDFLYGHRDGRDLASALDDMQRFDALARYTQDDWSRVLRRYLVDNTRLVVIGRPSAALAQRLQHETQARVAARRAELGEAGTQALEQALADARRTNDAPFPSQVLQDFAVPSSETIQWISVATAHSGPDAMLEPLGELSAKDSQLHAHVHADGEPLPFLIQFDQIPSQFVLVSVVISTEAVPTELRPYLTLYLAMLFSLPIERADGTKLSYEQVVQQLEDDVLDYDAAIGVGSSFNENLAVELKVPATRYEQAVGWMRDLLWGADFSLERVRVSAAKLAQSLPEQKRDGRMVSWALLRSLLYVPGRSTCEANSVLSQIQHVREITEALQSAPEQVLANLERIREALLRPEHMRFSVAGDILRLPAPRMPWRTVLPRVPAPRALHPLPWAGDVVNSLGARPARAARLCTVPAIESSYAVVTARGLSGYTDPDYAPLVVTLTILNAMESFLWRYIRGAGLAYGASIRNDAEAQHIHFLLYRAPDAARAFTEGRKVLYALAHGTPLDDGSSAVIDETMLETAKSSLHFSVAEAEGTVGAAALESFMDVRLKRVPRGRGRRLLKDASRVTLAEVQRCLRQYIVPLFDPATSVCAVATSSTSAESIRAQLTALGYDVEDVEMPVGGDESDASDAETASTAS
ncbi:metalloprotease [Actinomycetota bacterium]|nr:metalloprotease [Actinomycetota bacterium]